jgi:hypothetical protein
MLPDKKVSQDVLNKAVPLIETQFVLAGYRLAHILNELF